jgi:hypothetical protein
MPVRAIALALTLLGATISAALADDWAAIKLRGTVLQLVDQQWVPLNRGDIVSDDRVVRTLRNGRVEFQRDQETISLGPDTQIQIHDKTGQRFTTVTQYFGQVAIEAEVRNVQHFAVQTENLAAVVKGTRFVVTAGKGWSKVDVQRGHVAVESELTHSHTLLSVGQSAVATTTAELQVEGKGVLPAIVDDNGNVILTDAIDPKAAEKLAEELAKAAAKATGEEKKALEKAAKEAEKAAKDAEKAAEKAAKDADKSSKDAAKDAEKAEKDADKAAKDADKAAEKAAKDSEKAAEKADKEAEKAAKDEAKAAEKAAKEAAKD